MAVELVGTGEAKPERGSTTQGKEGDTLLISAQVSLLNARSDWFSAQAEKLRAEREVVERVHDLVRAEIVEQEHKASIAELELKQKQLEFDQLKDLLIDERKSEITRNVAKNNDQSSRIGERVERNSGQPRRSSPRTPPPQRNTNPTGGFRNTVRGGAEALKELRNEVQDPQSPTP